jgi:hypothetical protein
MLRPRGVADKGRTHKGSGMMCERPRLVAWPAVAAIAVNVAACAMLSASGNAPSGTSTINYMASDCSEIGEEIKALEARMKEFDEGRDPAKAACLNSAGLLGIPAGFAVGATCVAGGPTSARQVDYERLRAELNAARDAALQKQCPKAGPK